MVRCGENRIKILVCPWQLLLLCQILYFTSNSMNSYCENIEKWSLILGFSWHHGEADKSRIIN